MNLIIDGQLPPSLAKWLSNQKVCATHVRELGLARGKDWQVWEAAVERDAAVITKDEDFVEMSRFRRERVPIVWLRIGNCTNPALIEWFAPLWPVIRDKLHFGEILIEVLG